MRKIRLFLVFVFAKLLFLFHYDKKYCKGPLFDCGIFSPGWRLTVKSYFDCRRNRNNTDCPFPVSSRNFITGFSNISFASDSIKVFQGSGKYFQGIGSITIGSDVYIANNVGIITSNHDLYNLEGHTEAKEIVIGDHCWVGMNAVLLPGVILGERTIVGAGSVVTKPFPNGNCVVAGNPAKIIRLL